MSEPQNLDELQRICDNATPPPWDQWAHFIIAGDVDEGDQVAEVLNDRDDDVIFILAARSALPALIEESRVKDARIAALEAELAKRDVYVNVGTWLIPEHYGHNYDHFTETRTPTRAGMTIALYARSEDMAARGPQGGQD